MAACNSETLTNQATDQLQFVSDHGEGSESKKGVELKIPRDPMSWVQNQIANGVDAKQVLHRLIPEINVPDHVSELSLWRLVFEIITEPPPRQQLKNINSIEDAKRLIKECKNIIVLTGAGVSVSCGIPDFRSRDGIYARLSKDYPDLPDPQAMFDIHYFKNNPWPFFKFAKEIYPGQFVPSLSHRFIANLDKQGKLLRNYTQNIDTLEQVAGIKNIVQCHGSFATASCMKCKSKVDADFIKPDIFNQKIPRCKQCTAEDNDYSNILKPDIVFFGESLSDDFHKQIEKDKDKADLLIVIGSSLKVRPVSLIPDLIKADVPQILINREPLHHHRFDIEFFGNCDDIICELCHQLSNEFIDVIHNFKHHPLDKEIAKTLLLKSSEDNKSDSTSHKNFQQEQTLQNNKDNKNSSETQSCETKLDNIKRKRVEEASEKLSSDNSASNNSSSENSDIGNTASENSDIGNSASKNSDIGNSASSNFASENSDIGNSASSNSASSYSAGESKERDTYYISIPPNRYIFHGAEFDLDADSDSDAGSDTPSSSQDNMSIVEARSSPVNSQENINVTEARSSPSNSKQNMNITEACSRPVSPQENMNITEARSSPVNSQENINVTEARSSPSNSKENMNITEVNSSLVSPQGNTKSINEETDK